MSWRTVVINQRCKLDFKMGYMVVRGEKTQRVFLDELAVLILENPAVSLTGFLLEALLNRKVKIIFCDSRHLPQAELVPYCGNCCSSQKIREQLAWSEESKALVWYAILQAKLRHQAEYLESLGFEREPDLIRGYLVQMELADPSHREAHAAKVYFNAVFGMEFSRTEESAVNAALNYGYSILLAAFSREIAASGYLNQLGLFHSSMFNPFNLACDLMEPFRILVDKKVRELDCMEFGTEQKHTMVTVLENTVTVDNANQTVLNAIRMYCRSVFDSLTSSLAIKDYHFL